MVEIKRITSRIFFPCVMLIIITIATTTIYGDELPILNESAIDTSVIEENRLSAFEEGAIYPVSPKLVEEESVIAKEFVVEQIGFSHSSGGYWGYYDNEGNAHYINDSTLATYKSSPDLYSKAMLENHENYDAGNGYTFVHKMSSTLVNRLKNSKNDVAVVVSHNHPNEMSDFFVDTSQVSFEVDLAKEEIRITGIPILHFGSEYAEIFELDATFSNMLSNNNVFLPTAAMPYGLNAYYMYKDGNKLFKDCVSQNSGWGDPSGLSGSLPHYQSREENMNYVIEYEDIRYDSSETRTYAILGDGITKRGFTDGSTDSENDKITIGHQTVQGGGAVGISFYFYFMVQLVELETQDFEIQYVKTPGEPGEEVTDNDISPYQVYEEDYPLSIELHNTSVDMNNRYSWYKETSPGNFEPMPGYQKVRVDEIVYDQVNAGEFKSNYRMVVYDSGDSRQEEIDHNANFATVPDIVGSSDYVIDYDILSMDIRHYINGASGVTLSSGPAPRGRWIDNLSGTYNVGLLNTSGKDRLLDGLSVNGNSGSTSGNTLTLRPNLTFTGHRDYFWDNPLFGVYSANGHDYDTFSLLGSGSTSRRYRYSYSNPTPTNPNNRSNRTRTKSGILFNPRITTADPEVVTITAMIYNGESYISPVYHDTYIGSNSPYNLRKNLYWETEPYEYDVQRWMYHMDYSGNRVNPQAVPGQYQRTFTGQGSGEVAISINTDQQSIYQPARDAAGSRRQTGSAYDMAVFATDKNLQSLAYPVKSGYHFNPAGTYTFDVETVTYKTDRGATADHADLVDAMTDAFRYESNLKYINSYKDAVDISGDYVSDNDLFHYKSDSAYLTAADPYGVNNTLMLEVIDAADDSSRYTRSEKEISYATQASELGDMDSLWMEILEGYSHSGTEASHINFKYREFIQSGQSLYRITERTRVTIQINPYGTTQYTHANMADGDYFIKVWFDDVNLAASSHTYNTLGTLYGVDLLDEMEINVRGSMYDDIDSY